MKGSVEKARKRSEEDRLTEQRHDRDKIEVRGEAYKEAQEEGRRLKYSENL